MLGILIPVFLSSICWNLNQYYKLRVKHHQTCLWLLRVAFWWLLVHCNTYSSHFPIMSGSIFLTHCGLTACSLNLPCNWTIRTYSLCCTHWSENSQLSESEIMQCVCGDLEHLSCGSKKQVHWFQDMSSQMSRHITSIWRSLREEARGYNSSWSWKPNRMLVSWELWDICLKVMRRLVLKDLEWIESDLRHDNFQPILKTMCVQKWPQDVSKGTSLNND